MEDDNIHDEMCEKCCHAGRGMIEILRYVLYFTRRRTGVHAMYILLIGIRMVLFAPMADRSYSGLSWTSERTTTRTRCPYRT